jgi:hypothetical protein
MASNKIYQRFYKQMYSGNRAKSARVFDFILYNILIILFCFLWFMSQIHIPSLALVLTLLINILINAAIGIFKKKKLQKYIQSSRETYIKKQFLLHLCTMDQQKFFQQIKEILDNIPGLCHVEMKDTFYTAYYYNQKVLIYAKQNPTQSPVDELEFNNFMQKTQTAEAHYGIYITTSTFTDSAKKLAVSTSYPSIDLVDHALLYDLAQEIKNTPEISDLDKEILKEYINPVKKWGTFKKGIIAPGKTKPYAIASIIILISSYYTGYRYYYVALGSLCIIFAILSFFQGKNNKNADLISESNVMIKKHV